VTARRYVPATQLRVYVPLDTMPPDERLHWQRYLDEGGGITREEAARLEDRDALRRLVTGRMHRGVEEAMVRRAGRRVLLCPLDLDVRIEVALAAFLRAAPSALVRAMDPDGTLMDQPTVRTGRVRAPYILDEPWAPPRMWFACFDPSERRVHDHPEGAGRRISYLTSVGLADERIGRMLDVLEQHVRPDHDLLLDLALVGSWLGDFDDSSLLELDYRDVARHFTGAELAADHSCRELWDAIDALDVGAYDRAIAALSAYDERWRPQARRASAG
jgi:hypothetical protein